MGNTPRLSPSSSNSTTTRGGDAVGHANDIDNNVNDTSVDEQQPPQQQNTDHHQGKNKINISII